MSIVPIHKDIKNKQDVYFLVGSIINRQLKEFSIETIFKLSKKYLKGSSFKVSNNDLNDIIDQEINIFYRNGFIEKSNQFFILK